MPSKHCTHPCSRAHIPAGCAVHMGNGDGVVVLVSGSQLLPGRSQALAVPCGFGWKLKLMGEELTAHLQARLTKDNNLPHHGA